MGVKTNCTECGQTYEAPSEKYAEEPDRICGPCITKWAESQPCPDCGKGPVTSTLIDDSFQYRNGPDSVLIPCISPLRTCKACDFQFLDYETERTHLLAVNKYLISIGEKPQQS